MTSGKGTRGSMSRPSLFAYDVLVSTPFGLLGADEKSLTFALGYTMQQCPRLLQKLLAAVGLKRFRLARLADAEIRLQSKRDTGITDIEVILPGRLHLIIEAKVGLNLPTLGQCKKYIKRLNSSTAKERRLVMLVDSDAAPTLAVYREKDEDCREFMVGLRWAELRDMRPSLIQEFVADSDEGRWVRAFFDFLEGEFHMKTYTQEVWIIPAQTRPLWDGGWSFYDTHVKGRIYYRTKKDRYTNQKPLYIALRTRGKVDSIQRVLRIEHETKPIERLPQLKNVKGSWPREPHTIWHLSSPVPLPRAIPTGDPTMRGRHVYCDMDILLSSSTVKEAAERMKERNIGSG